MYVEQSGNPASNTLVMLSSMKAYILPKPTGDWQLIQNVTNIEGAAYAYDFVDDVSMQADVREEGEGRISAKLFDRYNYHFWDGSGLEMIDPNDIAGVFTTIEARTLLDNADDQQSAKILVSRGADNSESPSAQWDQWKTNGDVSPLCNLVFACPQVP